MPDADARETRSPADDVGDERHAGAPSGTAVVHAPHRRWPLFALAVAAKLAVIAALFHVSSAAALSFGLAHVLVLLVLLVVGIAAAIAHRRQRGWPHPGFGQGRR